MPLPPIKKKQNKKEIVYFFSRAIVLLLAFSVFAMDLYEFKQQIFRSGTKNDP